MLKECLSAIQCLAYDVAVEAVEQSIAGRRYAVTAIVGRECLRIAPYIGKRKRLVPSSAFSHKLAQCKPELNNNARGFSGILKVASWGFAKKSGRRRDPLRMSGVRETNEGL